MSTHIYPVHEQTSKYKVAFQESGPWKAQEKAKFLERTLWMSLGLSVLLILTIAGVLLVQKKEHSLTGAIAAGGVFIIAVAWIIFKAKNIPNGMREKTITAFQPCFYASPLMLISILLVILEL